MLWHTPATWTPDSEELDSPRHFLGARHPCQHHEVKNNLPKTPMLGLPEDDARMCSACGGQHKKISVACHENTPLRESVRKLLEIRSAAEPLVERCRNIDAALPESDSDGWVDVLVEVVRDCHPMPLSAAFAPSANKQTRSRLRLQRRDEIVVLANLPVDGLPMIVVVRQRRIHVCQRQVGERTHDFIRRLPRFRPNNDVLDPDS